MALLSTLVDQRTNAGLSAAATVSFAHGLPSTPDMVSIEAIATAATNGLGGFEIDKDATNVTITNNAGATGPDFRVTSLALHSIIR